MFSPFSFASDRQSTRASADATGADDSASRAPRNAFRPGSAATPPADTRAPRDVAVSQADGEP